MSKTVLCSEILEFIPIKAAGTVVPGSEPDIPLAILGDVFNAQRWKAMVYRIGLLGTYAAKWLDHKNILATPYRRGESA